MFRTDSLRRTAAVLLPLACTLALAGAAAAQTSFEDGSFASTPEPERQATGGAWPTGPGDSFGGSFDGESAAAPVSDPPAETPEAPPPEETAEADAGADAEPEPEAPDVATDAEDVDPILAFELRDYGVAPTNWLRQGAFHSPTPIDIPGGMVITTEDLTEAIRTNDMTFVLIDVLGGEYRLPNALSATQLAAPGTYGDRTQQQAALWLAQVTGSNPGVPIVLYCSDPMCWLSYNAALRTIAAGYSNVFWYRGGLQAWQMAGLPVFPSGF